jgi:hypothetical protein
MLYIRHFLLIFFTGLMIILLFTSYVPNTDFETVIADNQYIKVTGKIENEIINTMSFIEASEQTNKGVAYTTLTLKLDNSKENKIAILISKEQTTAPIQTGVYQIKNLTSENQTNGVFGYYNRITSNELPFFTEEGKVIITVKTPTTVRGYLELNLRSVHHEKIKIQGNFTAKNLN